MEDKELKHEFELERVILFTDAVFAIVITIMMLDIKFPDSLKHAAPDDIRHVIKELFFKLLAYLLSFFIVSSFWIRHLGIFKTLRDYNIGLVVRNLFFLFIISLFPFAVSTTSGFLSLESYWSADIYVSIILIGIFAQTLLVHYIINHKNELCLQPARVEETLKWKRHRLNFFLIPLTFVAVIFINLVHAMPLFVLYVMPFYAVALRIISRRLYPGKSRLAAGSA